MSADTSTTQTRIGLAFSGGGHRAACWSSGAALGLIDAGRGDDIVSVASVSGGSLTNALLATSSTGGFPGRGPFEAALRGQLREWANDGLFFPGPPTDRATGRVLGIVAAALCALPLALGGVTVAGRGWSSGALAILWAIVGLIGVGVAVWVARTKVPRPLSGMVVVGAMVGVVGGGALVPLALRHWWWAAVGVALEAAILVVAIRQFGSRSEIVERALHDGLCDRRELRSITSPVHHVFCSTNLRSGEHLYLSNRIVWGFTDQSGTDGGVDGVLAEPGDVSLALAVQSSACMPGGFLARSLRPRDLPTVPPLHQPVTLSDGGVYDNMADQWERGFDRRGVTIDEVRRRRSATLPALADAQAVAATHLVVVNASRRRIRAVDVKTRPGLMGEIRSLSAAQSVQYEVSTSGRRRALIDGFRHAHRTGEGQDGILVHINTSPYQVIDAMAVVTDDRAARSAAARAVLDLVTDEMYPSDSTEQGRRATWRAICDRNSAIATTLAALDGLAPGNAASLLHHAWVLTRVSAFVLHGWGTLPEPRASGDDLYDWGLGRFEALVGGETRGQRKEVGGVVVKSFASAFAELLGSERGRRCRGDASRLPTVLHG